MAHPRRQFLLFLIYLGLLHKPDRQWEWKWVNGMSHSVHPNPQKALLFCPWDRQAQNIFSLLFSYSHYRKTEGSPNTVVKKTIGVVLTGHVKVEVRLCPPSQPGGGPALDSKVVGDRVVSVSPASPSFLSTSIAEFRCAKKSFAVVLFSLETLFIQ